jgi:hypothetical protein
MKRNEARSDTSRFHSNVRAEDELGQNPEEYSVYRELLVPLGVIAAIFAGCLLVPLTRC